MNKIFKKDFLDSALQRVRPIRRRQRRQGEEVTNHITDQAVASTTYRELRTQQYDVGKDTSPKTTQTPPRTRDHGNGKGTAGSKRADAAPRRPGFGKRGGASVGARRGPQGFRPEKLQRKRQLRGKSHRRGAALSTPAARTLLSNTTGHVAAQEDPSGVWKEEPKSFHLRDVPEEAGAEGAGPCPPAAGHHPARPWVAASLRGENSNDVLPRRGRFYCV